MRTNFLKVVSYAAGVFVYSTLGFLTKNIVPEFYLGTSIGLVFAIVIAFCFDMGGRSK